MVGQFIAQDCIVHPNARVSVTDLYQAYRNWAGENGDLVPLDQRTFGKRIRAKGFKQHRHGHNRAWTWFRICLKIDARVQHLSKARTNADVKSLFVAEKLNSVLGER